VAAKRRYFKKPFQVPASSGLVLLLLAVSGLAIVTLVILSALWAGSESDAAALDRQRRLVNSRLQDQVQRVSNELRVMSAGLSSLLHSYENRNRFQTPPVEFGSHDPEIISPAATFNRIATTLFGYDAAFIVTSAGDTPYENDRAVTRRFKWVRPLLQPLLTEVERNKALPRTSMDPGASTPSLSRVALMRLEGRPAVAGVIPVGDDFLSDQKDASVAPAQPLYLITFRFLDGATLDSLSREQGLSGARYARAADQDQMEVAFQIEATSSRDPIGFIIWKPDLPGSRVIGRLAPALSVAAFSFLALFLALVVWLRRAMERLSKSEAIARHLAHHDVLTGLPNRAMFAERLHWHLTRLDARPTGLAVALIDLDKFKHVNDEHGHPAGDELLLKVVDRINSVIDGDSMLARLGGDEFALILPHLSLGTPCDATPCSSIVEALARPFLLLGDTVTVSIGCSIGIAAASLANYSESEILRCADVALYQAKSKGRGRLITYDQSMDLEVQNRDRLRSELETVLESALSPDTLPPGHATACGSLELFMQGIHRSDGAADLIGAEALIRWQHPLYGLLTPDKFIPIAEDSGLIHRLGEWVLIEASKAAAQWDAELCIAVNISPSQLHRADFAAQVASILNRTGLAPHRLELEVTEAALLKLGEHASANLITLKSMGVRIALDDFGTGFSSLSHLINFDVDRIKIDRSFVGLIGSKAEGTAIVSAMVDLSRTLGKSITAEGVETAGQRDFLAAIGCTDLQGYLFSRPVSSRRFNMSLSAAARSASQCSLPVAR
jgi:diguanylate cyclase (GGDEF)-like protein